MGCNSQKVNKFVVSGDKITDEQPKCNIYGTFLNSTKGEHIANLTGYIEHINKVIKIRQSYGLYQPMVGDYVVGSVTEVKLNRWSIDISFGVKSYLNLNSFSNYNPNRKNSTYFEVSKLYD